MSANNRLSWAAAALQQHVSETTAHGLGRVTGSRSIALRLFWAVSFVTMCVLCCVSLHSALQRLQRREQNTAFYAESVPFEFPDLYVCGLSPISASFSLNLTKEQSDEINALVYNISHIANLSVNAPISTPDNIRAIMNSLPYHILVDTLGHRHRQMVFFGEIEGEFINDPSGGSRRVSSNKEFYHPKYLRCTQIVLSEQQRNLMRQSGNELMLFMIADAPIPEYTMGSHQITLTLPGGIRIEPTHWNFKNGWNIYAESGLRLFLVEPNTYPSDWSTSVILKPGAAYDIQVSMQQTEYNEEEFSNKCLPVSQLQQVQYDNPYSADNPYNFSYSYAYCYYTELTKKEQSLLNCTASAHPKPSSFSSIQSCYNVNGNITANEFITRLNKMKSLSEQLQSAADEASRICTKRQACSRKSYSVQQSNVDWPQQKGIYNFILISYSIIYNFLPKPLMMLDFVYSYAFSQLPSYPPASNLTQLARSQLVQVRLFSEGQYSTRVQISIDYTFLTFIAEAGGLLGLYLGCSALTLGELVELLYCIIAAASTACSKRTARIDGGVNIDENGAKSVSASTGENMPVPVEVE